MPRKKRKEGEYVAVRTSVQENMYELVPEKKFQALEKDVVKLLANPLLKVDTTKQLMTFMETLNESILSLFEVLRKVNEDTSFEEKEEEYVRKQIKPLAQSVREIKNQNETIATGMINIIDRLNDIQRQLNELKENVLPIPSPTQNPMLPPLTGGPLPPDMSAQMNQISPPPFSSSIPPAGNAIPPLQMGDLGKKKSFFR